MYATVQLVMARLTVTEARAQMREAIEKVKAGEEVEITQNGEVVAVWVHPSTRRPVVRTPATVAAARLHDELERARKSPLPTIKAGLNVERAEAWVREIRADRDRGLEDE